MTRSIGPVINGRGELIGLAFDGNWEAMSGDLVYDPEYKRCINMDARYLLFIIDKFAGAGHLVNEMTLVNQPNPNGNTASAATTSEEGKTEVKVKDDKTKTKTKKEERKKKKKMKS